MSGARARLVLFRHRRGRGGAPAAARRRPPVGIPVGARVGDRLHHGTIITRLPAAAVHDAAAAAAAASGIQPQRCFGTKKMRECPFGVLGVSKSEGVVDYGTVKRSFLRLAMTHHPDTAESDDDEDKREAVELFMRVREAFDAIVELDDGSAALRADHEKDGHGMSGEEFDHWFYEETGHNAPNPFDLNLDQATLREVAKSQELSGGGELDRGGMWAMASMVTRGLGGQALGPQLRLEGGDVTTTSADGTRKIRRRRRR